MKDNVQYNSAFKSYLKEKKGFRKEGSPRRRQRKFIISLYKSLYLELCPREEFIFCLLQGIRKINSPHEYSLPGYLRWAESGNDHSFEISMVLFGTKQNVCEEMSPPNMKTTTSGQCIRLF